MQEWGFQCSLCLGLLLRWSVLPLPPPWLWIFITSPVFRRNTIIWVCGKLDPNANCLLTFYLSKVMWFALGKDSNQLAQGWGCGGSHCVSAPPQLGRGGRAQWKVQVEIRTGTSPSKCHHRQNRLCLRKSAEFIANQIRVRNKSPMLKCLLPIPSFLPGSTLLHSLPPPGEQCRECGPSHGRWFSMDFSPVSPSHGLQLFPNCSSVVLSHPRGLRKGLLQQRVPVGSQPPLGIALSSCGVLLMPWEPRTEAGQS